MCKYFIYQMYMTIKKGYAFRYERKKGVMWAPTRAVAGRRRRPAMCATLKFPRVRRVAKDLKIKLQTKRDGKRDKPQLCEMIKRKVGVNRTPISVQIRKMVAPRKKKAARKAAPKKPINLTTMFPSSTKKPAPAQKPSVSNSNSNSNDNSSNFRIVYKQAPVSPKPPIKRQRPQEVRRGGGANAASINAAMNKIKRGQALTPEENMKLEENVRRTQRARWSSVVNRHSNSAGAPDPLSNEEFRKLRSKYTEGRATKVAKTGNLRAAGKVYTFR